MSYVGGILGGIGAGYAAIALPAASSMATERIAERATDDVDQRFDGVAIPVTATLGAITTGAGVALAAMKLPVPARIGGAALALVGVGALGGLVSGVQRN